MKQLTITLPDENSVIALAQRLAPLLPASLCFYLKGDLGAGKTTFVRAILKHLGVDRRVKSPTYTLVESYELPNTTAHHFDLYRLSEPFALEEMGFRDYLSGLLFIEWPQNQATYLPPADLTAEFELLPKGRKLTLIANSPYGEQVSSKLEG